MKVKELMQVITNLRFEVFNVGKETKSNLLIKDFGNEYFRSDSNIIIKIYKLDSGIGFEYELFKSIKKSEYMDFLRDDEIMNMEIAKDCDISILPAYYTCNGNPYCDTTNCLLKIYVK